MKACILCGGKGTRLRPLTFDRPKPMVPLLNKPTIQHLVESLVASGFDDIVITLGYQGEQIKEYLNDGALFGAHITYSFEDKKLGTAGSVKNAKKYLDDGAFLVMGGDIALDFNLKEIYNFHKKNTSIATIAITCTDDPTDFGIVEIDVSNDIKKFKEKPKPGEIFSNLASTGIYVCDPEIFDWIPSNKKYDFAKDLFPTFLENGKKLIGWLSPGKWSDIGSIKMYKDANSWKLRDMNRTEITGDFLSNGNIRGPITVKNGVRIGYNTSIVGPTIIGERTVIGNDVLISPFTSIGSNCIIESDSRILSTIFYDHIIIKSGSVVSSTIIDNNTTIGRDCVVETGVVIGPRVVVGDKSKIKSYVKIWPDVEIPPGSVVSEDILNDNYDTSVNGS
ncbi:MAG: NDP-sugar synthase [Candidatus Methanoliparum thermophilum]|uniref:Bifunctional protein GlmU n=1 Tax=Methanoliparum thermophilum TaxID=2491083 RepID=A0A520KRZ6_METT2|nr:NDP-sugar synthase [Candidatus Methanoliparum sp. LAM-1]RZN64560.1 MAG: NDP-sugar synthase [Candidatus Methanoliparum thermophilum]BDC35841.1 mannose-1-phosphate guanyltransferase [Candidatus Methanoliparum sp. LAM-1]